MQITGFNPTQGQAGTQVTIRLSDMPADAEEGNTFVFLSGSPVVDVGEVTVGPNRDGTVRITISELAQTGDFVVVSGNATAQSSTPFTVERPQEEAAITNMTPRTAARGTQVTLTGRHLDEVQSVTVGSVKILNLPTHTATQIRFTVPNALQPGNHRVVGHSQRWGNVNAPAMLTVT